MAKAQDAARHRIKPKIKRYVQLRWRMPFADSVGSCRRCCNKKNKHELIPSETLKLELNKFTPTSLFLSYKKKKKKKSPSRELLMIRKLSANNRVTNLLPRNFFNLPRPPSLLCVSCAFSTQRSTGSRVHGPVNHELAIGERKRQRGRIISPDSQAPSVMNYRKTH